MLGTSSTACVTGQCVVLSRTVVLNTPPNLHTSLRSTPVQVVRELFDNLD